MVDLDEFGKINILSIEDDFFNQALASAIFEPYSRVTVLKALNGKDALAILREEKNIDVVLLDLMMPILNGYETLSIMKNSDECKDIPIIVVTAEMQEEKKSLELGASHFISKPYKPTQIRQKVKDALLVKR